TNSTSCNCLNGNSGQFCEFSPYLYVSSVYPAYESGGLVELAGSFSHVHKNLSVSIGSYMCYVIEITPYSIKCNIEGFLSYSNFYDISISQNYMEYTGHNIYKPNLMKPCFYGVLIGNECVCDNGWYGENCEMSTVKVYSVTPVSTRGGDIYIHGFFGDITNLYFFINNTIINFNYVSSSYVIGKAPPGNGYQDLRIFNQTSGSVVFEGIGMVYFDPFLCMNNCSYNGVCNFNFSPNCQCDYNWTGEDCS
ncbi:hypothetical protein DICPUDRAFT_9634, partial [Dictyostelium purpureum]